VTGGASRRGQYALGVEGVALLRLWLTGDPEAVEARLAEVRDLAARLDSPELAAPAIAPEAEAGAAYARWAPTYDGPNAVIRREERVTLPLLDGLPGGEALDAACGTGRYARHLLARGHRVLGVDASPEMLEVARERTPGATFQEGTLEALPLDGASVDLAVCALALTHCPRLDRPIGELARVVRPGGRVLLADLHPVVVWLGGHAVFADGAGGRAFVRNLAHPHSAYLDAFAASGLTVERCLEPLVTAADLPEPVAPEMVAAQRAAFVGLPGSLVWLLRRDRRDAP
jgi:ubiquinone/menaquinone biosynthesis C-methylase UbiE